MGGVTLPLCQTSDICSMEMVMWILYVLFWGWLTGRMAEGFGYDRFWGWMFGMLFGFIPIVIYILLGPKR